MGQHSSLWPLVCTVVKRPNGIIRAIYAIHRFYIMIVKVLFHGHVSKQAIQYAIFQAIKGLAHGQHEIYLYRSERSHSAQAIGIFQVL